MPEYNWLEDGGGGNGNGSEVLLNATLWEMGNRCVLVFLVLGSRNLCGAAAQRAAPVCCAAARTYTPQPTNHHHPNQPNSKPKSLISAAEDVHFWAETLRGGLNDTRSWQYIYNNGRQALFDGYTWSLDTFVDFTWLELGKLSQVMIILLVIEVCGRFVFVLCFVCFAAAVNNPPPPKKQTKQNQTKTNSGTRRAAVVHGVRVRAAQAGQRAAHAPLQRLPRAALGDNPHHGEQADAGVLLCCVVCVVCVLVCSV